MTTKVMTLVMYLFNNLSESGDTRIAYGPGKRNRTKVKFNIYTSTPIYISRPGTQNWLG